MHGTLNLDLPCLELKCLSQIFIFNPCTEQNWAVFIWVEVVKWEVEESQGTESAAEGKRLNRPVGCAVLETKGEEKRKMMCLIPALTTCLDLFCLFGSAKSWMTLNGLIEPMKQLFFLDLKQFFFLFCTYTCSVYFVCYFSPFSFPADCGSGGKYFLF